MRDFLAIILNRFITLICKILKPFFHKDGSVTPGFYASKLDSKILNKLKYPKLIIGVTGSSGKGSTTSLINHVLTGNGYKVLWNNNGSNLYNAAATLILNNTNPFTKKINADVLLLELDEAFIKSIFDEVKLTHLVITNITRDQPARNGHVDIIFEKIKSSIDENTHLIINADDPIVGRFKLFHKGLISTYGINKTKYSLKYPLSNTLDAGYCPNCFNKLKYKFYHYGHIGDYKCSKCAFSRSKVDYEADEVNLEKHFMTINDTLIHLNKDVFFCAYYTLATFALCQTIGLTTEKIKKYLNEEIMPAKRMKEYHLGKRKVELLESKNENALSYLQSINYIKNKKGKKTIILGFDNVSRRYSYNDLSWLYDVDFELLNDDNITKIFCIGRFNRDVYARLMNAKINPDKIILVDDVKNLINLVKTESTGNIYTMVCFDMTAIIKRMLEGEK